MSCLRMEGISFRYGARAPWVIRNFALKMEPESILAIKGESGCGKSTLLRIIAGLEWSQEGKIWLEGTLVASEKVFREPQHRGVGMIFQDYALFPHMTVWQNVLFGLHRMSRKEKHARASRVLELVSLGGYEKRYPYELSGGQQQRVAIARAMAPAPKILLLDEPFSNLDAALRERVRRDIRQILKGAGMAAILVTHDVEEAESFADRVVTLYPPRLE